MNRILVIDDEAALRFFARELLEDMGFEVLEAESGRTGLDKIFTEDPDAVLTDLRMPGVDGLEVLRVVAEKKPDLPVLVISGAGLLTDAVEALRLGAWDYILKPIRDAHILKHTLDRALERAQLLKIKRHYQESLESMVRRGEEELQKSRESLNEKSGILEALFNNIPMGLYYLSPDGVFMDANDAMARLFGKSREDMIGRSVKDFPDQPALAKLYTPENNRLQIHCFQAGEDSLELAVQQSAILSEAGKPMGLVGFVLDVSEPIKAERGVKEQEQELFQADKLISLGILAASVAHEINNPTQVIMSNTPVVRRAWADVLPILDGHAEQAGEFSVAGMPYFKTRDRLDTMLAAIEEGAGRIKGIVHSMKDFSRLDPEDQWHRVDVNQVVKAALNLVNGKLEKSCRKVQLHLGKGLPGIRASGLQVEQVLVNLILNAAEALPSPDKGMEIATTCNAAANEIRVVVRDEGRGISTEAMKNIFDPFFTTKRDTGGTGLGLAISKRIVQKHGGNITFDSRAGRGTTAVVSLPCVSEIADKGDT